MDLNEQMEKWDIIGIKSPEKKTKFPKNKIATSLLSEQLNIKLHDLFSSRIVQNYILIWLYSDRDDVNDLLNSIIQLQRIVNTINIFADVDQCIDFLTDIKEEKILMIMSDKYGQNLVSIVHDIHQIHSIYILGKTELQREQWPKVKGIFTASSPICQALKQDTHNCDQDSISISFVPINNGKTSQNLDQLNPTFMYTQILKEILVTIAFNDEHIKDFARYYRGNFANNTIQLNNIDEFERNYKNHSPIWWYTHECCLYSILNRALRLMEVDTIIKMGFFIRDLHNQIEQLHLEQYGKHQQFQPFTTYRGQGLSKADFDKMLETQGGLISFNNFLSTSTNPAVAFESAQSSFANSTSVGIVFVITIDPSLKSTSFACIDDFGHYNTPQEILLSMHTVFRIGNMIQSKTYSRIWQVDLIQTNDKDPQLHELTERIRKEIRGSTEWDRLAKLLIKLGQFNEADKLYEALIDQTSHDREKTHFYHQLGWSKKQQKKYVEAITFYEKSLELKLKLQGSNFHSIVMCFNDIGSVYEKMNQYSKALLYYEKGFTMQLERSSSTTPSSLVSSCSNIGSVYEKLGEYSKALKFHEKALKIRREMDPSSTHTIAYSHNNIGSVYGKMGEYTKALSSHNEALEIQQKMLPSNHPDIAQTYSSIGFIYSKMSQYVEAHQFHQHAVDIGQRSLPVNHPRLQQWRKNLEFVKRKM